MVKTEMQDTGQPSKVEIRKWHLTVAPCRQWRPADQIHAEEWVCGPDLVSQSDMIVAMAPHVLNQASPPQPQFPVGLQDPVHMGHGIWLTGLRNLVMGGGSSANCHCCPPTKFLDPREALQVRSQDSVGQIWPIGQGLITLSQGILTVEMWFQQPEGESELGCLSLYSQIHLSR